MFSFGYSDWSSMHNPSGKRSQLATWLSLSLCLSSGNPRTRALLSSQLWSLPRSSSSWGPGLLVGGRQGHLLLFDLFLSVSQREELFNSLLWAKLQCGKSIFSCFSLPLTTSPLRCRWDKEKLTLPSVPTENRAFIC